MGFCPMVGPCEIPVDMRANQIGERWKERSVTCLEPELKPEV